MNQQILVPLDGSALAEVVMPYAAALARANSAELMLLQVIAPSELRETSGWGSVPASIRAGWVETALARVQTSLEAVAEPLRAAGIVAHTEVLSAADVAAAIVARAERDPDMSMIAMATHGRSGLGRWLLGSVAEKVLQAASRPLLLVRAREQKPSRPTELSYRRILVPLDGSPFAEQALDEAQAIAAATGATLVLVAVAPVVEDAALAEVGVVPGWAEAARQAEVEQLGRYLMSMAERLSAEGFMVRPHVVDGIPAEEILRASATQHADLIVMATHGRTGVQRLWIGSVATKVVRSTDVPVLLVRAQC